MRSEPLAASIFEGRLHPLTIAFGLLRAARGIVPADSRLPLDWADDLVHHPLDRDRPYASGRDLGLEARRHTGPRELRALDSERGAGRVLHGENVDDAYALLHRTEVVRFLCQDSVRGLGGQCRTQWEEKRGEEEEVVATAHRRAKQRRGRVSGPSFTFAGAH